MGTDRTALKSECIRLRVEERLSLKDIQKRTGVSRGTCSSWLSSFPLTQEERRASRNRSRREEGLRRRKPIAPKSPLSLLASRHQKGALKPAVKAKIAEAAVALRLALLGLSPLVPAFGTVHADYVVELPDGRMAKIQVKWAGSGRVNGSATGLPYATIRRTHGHSRRARYKPGEFDFFCVYCLHSDCVYVWSAKEVRDRTSITVHPDAAERWDKLL